MRAENLETGEIYHICNRSTEGISVFNQPKDAKRFLNTLFYSNGNTKNITMRNFSKTPRRYSILKEQQHAPLVEVYAIVLMRNHFHICARQLVDKGVSIWMQRVCNSYARYFNIKNNRKGSLFMGRFRAVHVAEDKQFFHLLVYIHTNPLDLIMPEWREGKVSNWRKAQSFLQDYRWSSYCLYTDEGAVSHEIQQLISTRFPQEVLIQWGGLTQGIKEWSLRTYINSKNIFIE